MVVSSNRVRGRFRQLLLGFAALGMALGASQSVAVAQEPGPLAPAALRCTGFVDAEALRPSPEHRLTGWEYRWEVLSEDASLTGPMGVAIDSACNVYVANYEPLGGSILKLAPSGEVLGRWGSAGKGVGQFERLEGIAVDGAGNVYTADSGNNRIQRFNAGGVVDAIWADQFACRAITTVACHTVPQDAEFHGSLSVAVDGAGSLYVIDGAFGVKKFAPTGALVARWGTALSDAPGGFRAGDGAAFDGSGNLYVADGLLNQVQKFGPDGALLGRFAIADESLLLLDHPRGVAVDLSGSVYVVDTDNQRLVVFAASGEPLAWAGRCSEEGLAPCPRMTIGDQPGEFAFPHHVATNARAELLVADRFNRRVQALKAYPLWEAPMPVEGASE